MGRLQSNNNNPPHTSHPQHPSTATTTATTGGEAVNRHGRKPLTIVLMMVRISSGYKVICKVSSNDL